MTNSSESSQSTVLDQSNYYNDLIISKNILLNNYLNYIDGNMMNNLENQNDEKNQENPTENKEKETKDETIDPHLIFQKELLNIINKQEKILTSTSTINEKFGVSNEITKEQISTFKANIDKYGKYLIMIKKELGIISSTMQKIKKLAKEKDNKVQK